MVWQAAQSGLYSAVERNNRFVLSPQNAAVVVKESPKQAESKLPQEPSSAAQHSTSASEDNRQALPQSGERSSSHNNQLRALFSDKDALILAALILLLWHEKADIKLITALAFVLLA